MEINSALQKLKKMAVRKLRKRSEDKQTTKKKKKKKKKVNMFVSLPDDMILDILKRLPDAFLRYKVKFVCRQWFDIITNKILLDHASFILQKPTGIYTARHVDIREEEQGLEMKEQNLRIPYIGTIRSWCNEFLVIKDLYRKGCMYIFDLITKKGSYLPGCTSCVGCFLSCECGVALSFDRLKGVYKVLCVHTDSPMQFHILTLKRDILLSISSKWRQIEVPGYMSQYMQNWRHPVSVQGRYFHWNVHSSKYLVSMDMVKEKIFQLYLPRICGDHMRYPYSVFEMGGFLYLIGEANWDKVDIWILKDFQTIEWEKLHSVTLLDRCFRIRHISSVIGKRYIIFKKNGFDNIMYSYDMKDGVIKQLNINIEYGDYYVVHSSAPRFYASSK